MSCMNKRTPLVAVFLSLILIGMWLISTLRVSQAAVHQPDIRIILQTQAGLTAYTVFTQTVSLDYVRPLFSHIDLETNDYILGDYTLASRVDKVKLVIDRDGWALAYHQRNKQVQHYFDCAPTFFSSMGWPERAIREIREALGIQTPIGFYDFRNPQATGIVQHSLYIANNGSQQGTLSLPLGNSYIEQGYVFCTALLGSKFWLNNELVYQFSASNAIHRHWGTLTPAQLRAGQSNELKTEVSFNLFATGFIAGVAAVYSGNVEIESAGGDKRILTMTYPTMLGEPMELHHIFLPVMGRP
jgi:hypothetical protein